MRKCLNEKKQTNEGKINATNKIRTTIRKNTYKNRKKNHLYNEELLDMEISCSEETINRESDNYQKVTRQCPKRPWRPRIRQIESDETLGRFLETGDQPTKVKI